MPSRSDLLLGQIALDKGFISQDDLDECLRIQETNPEWKQLGMILLDKKLISEEDLEIALEIQKKNLESNIDNTDLKLKDILFGRIVITRRLATQSQVNECLREQERIERMGIFLRLGEIMIRKGYLSETHSDEIIEYQNAKLDEFRKEALGD
ncbi:MAG: hypothetical protein ACYTHM_00515 [Planctomycetota bacterium]|jgi:hypothetical protein